MNEAKSYLWLLGRILLSQIFLLSGVMKIFNWSQTAEYMASEGMVAIPFFLSMAILCEIGGGLSILLGFKARLGALVLALFLIPVTLVFHHFWTYEGMAMHNQMQHFLKNLTIMGGLWTIVAVGSGPLSVDPAARRALAYERAEEPLAEALAR